MLFMIIERFRDTKLLGERFKLHGRMLPDNVTYQVSWVDPATNRCYQVMEAPDTEALAPWIKRWDDLVDFEVITVLTSHDFWAKVESGVESEDLRAADQR
jgi:uncharacterized protein DUF3303